MDGACGSAFIEVEGGVPKVSQINSLLVNLKHKSGIEITR